MNIEYAVLGQEPKKNIIKRLSQNERIFIVPIDKYKTICPKDYFITTGEATIKIDVVIKDLKQLLKEMIELKKLFIKTKGESSFLETCWEDRQLLVKRKEARPGKVDEDSDEPIPEPTE